MRLLLVCLAMLMVSCNGDVPEPPPLPPTTTTTTQWEPQPNEYFHLSRVGHYEAGGICVDHTGMVQAVCYELQYATWAGWRDPLYTASNCSNLGEESFGISGAELAAFGDAGMRLVQEGQQWMTRLPVVNRRCSGDSRWCARSNVRKTDYPDGRLPAFKLWRAAFDSHMQEANRMRDAVADDPIKETCGEYDSIKGWCQCYEKFS